MVATISSLGFYYFYKGFASKKSLSNTIKNHKEVLKIQSLLWKTVSEHYINNEAGVYLDNIGYFCHIMRPNRKFWVALGIVSREGSGGVSYRNLVLDFRPVNQYYHVELTKMLKKRVRYFVLRGRKYKFLYREIFARRKALPKRKIYRMPNCVIRK